MLLPDVLLIPGYPRERYSKKDWDNIGLAYTAAKAITDARDGNLMDFQAEFSLQLHLYKIDHRKHLEKQTRKEFNEAFRIDEYNKESLKKHRYGETNYDPDLLTYKDRY